MAASATGVFAFTGKADDAQSLSTIDEAEFVSTDLATDRDTETAEDTACRHALLYLLQTGVRCGADIGMFLQQLLQHGGGR